MLAVLVIVLLVALVAIGVVAMRQARRTAIDNFADCKAAGGVIMESYPEQCRIDGRTFVNEAQRVQDASDYVGLSEQEALDKAAREETPARVIERDGQALPATMDFRHGRHNFSVQDGVVYHVDIEGEATDGGE